MGVKSTHPAPVNPPFPGFQQLISSTNFGKTLWDAEEGSGTQVDRRIMIIPREISRSGILLGAISYPGHWPTRTDGQIHHVPFNAINVWGFDAAEQMPPAGCDS